MMYGLDWGGNWFGHTFFGGFFMIIVWVAIIVFVIWAIRELSGGNHNGRGHRNDGTDGGRTALTVLKERYAKGEIDKKEFEDKKKDLL